MKKFLYILLLTIVLFLAPVFIHNILAAGPPPPPPPKEIPIDGGLGLLLAAGVGYAAKKLHSSKKNSNTPPV